DGAEAPDKRLLTRATHAADLVQAGDDGPFPPHVAVVRNGEAVRLVAQPLHQEKGLRGARQDDRVRAAGQKQLLVLLGQRRYWLVCDAQLPQRLQRRAELALTAIHDDQVGTARPLRTVLAHPRRKAEDGRRKRCTPLFRLPPSAFRLRW